jgi:hypothetical protein
MSGAVPDANPWACADDPGMTTTSGMMTASGALRRFAGQLIPAGGPGYDQARALYNGIFDKRPTLIARCTSARDVRLALAYARDRGLAVRAAP